MEKESKEKFLKNLKELVTIPAPTDHESVFLRHLEDKCTKEKLPFGRIEFTNLSYATVPPLLIGDLDAEIFFVTHCDRVCENEVIRLEDDIINGRLDNSVNVAMTFEFMAKHFDQYQNIAQLITTSEECGNNNYNFGGRGFVEFLYQVYFQKGKDFKNWLSQKNFICLDVRPLDNNDVFSLNGSHFNLGDGIVLREAEMARNLYANPEILNVLLDIASDQEIRYTLFPGKKGITEIGRGYEKFLANQNIPAEDYKVAWLQIPLRNYHTENERVSINDVCRQWDLMKHYVIKNK